jgi:hypothetical protein
VVCMSCASLILLIIAVVGRASRLSALLFASRHSAVAAFARVQGMAWPYVLAGNRVYVLFYISSSSARMDWFLRNICVYICLVLGCGAGFWRVKGDHHGEVVRCRLSHKEGWVFSDCVAVPGGIVEMGVHPVDPCVYCGRSAGVAPWGVSVY